MRQHSNFKLQTSNKLQSSNFKFNCLLFVSYLNFGVWGIIFGMLFFGTLFRFIFDFFIGKSNFSLSGIVIYSIFWIQIIKGTEDWIAPVWAGLVKLFVILLIIHLFLAKDKSQNTT